MGQKPVPPVNIPIPTKKKKRIKWVVHLPQHGTIGFDPQPGVEQQKRTSSGMWVGLKTGDPGDRRLAGFVVANTTLEQPQIREPYLVIWIGGFRI